MAPSAVKTYKGKDKKKRTWANIQNVLSEIINKEEKESISVFEALFTKNIKGLKSKRTGKDYRNKENISHWRQLPYKTRVEINLDISHNSTFDRILAGPVYEHPRPLDVSHKSEEFSISGISTSGTKCDTRISASDPSYIDNTLLPVTWKPRKKLGLPKRRKILKCVSEKTNTPLHFKKYQKDALAMSPFITSTPNRISCRENNLPSPLLSPILHCVRKGQRSEVINDITEDKRNSVCDSTLHSKSVVCILDAGKNILPEVHQFDPSVKGSNMSNELLPSSVVEESASKSLCKFAIDKVKSCHVSAGAVLSDSVELIEDVSSQLESCKLDEKIVSAIGSSDVLNGLVCELRKSKDTFTGTDQKFDAAKQSSMNDSVSTVSVSGSHQNLAVHCYAEMNLRRQQNRWIKCVERSLCRSDGSDAEELLGFSDVPLEQHLPVDSITESFLGLSDVSVEQHSCDDPRTGGFMGLSDVSVEQHSCDDPRTGGFMGLEDVAVEQDLCEDPITRGFLHLSYIPIEQDICKDAVTDVVPPNLCSFSGNSNKCAESNGVTEGVNIEANLPSSESRNMSVVLFDSWNSGNGTKLESAFGRLSENREAVIFDKSQVSISGVQNNHSENTRADVSKHHHLHKSSVDVDESDGKYARDKSELLCSSISKEHLFQEPSDTIIGTEKLSIPAKIESTTVTVKMQKLLRRQSSRRLSRQVVPSHSISGPPGRLLSFHDMCRNSTCKTANNDLGVSVPEGVEEFELLSIGEECLVSAFSARDAVLHRCHQHAPISFSEAFPASYWLTCRKIGEGVYGEVFLSEGQEKSVLKIIPFGGEGLVNGEPQKKFEEILSEVVIAMELSGLRNGTDNRTSSFSEVKHCLCVQGAYPEKLIDLWNDYDTNKGSENDSPTLFMEDQLYIILVLTHGGCDLESHSFTNAEQSHSILIQVGYALAVAEQVLEFEHRDLHWGNVLVSRTTEKNVTFKLCGKEYAVPTKGVRVTIIDFTLSRMTYDGCYIYNDLSKDPALFTAEGDYQFEVYRLMQKQTLNSWHHFNPYTNLLWLHYLLDKMCTMVNYLRVSSKSHKRGMKMLMKLQDVVLKHRSTQDFILNGVT